MHWFDQEASFPFVSGQGLVRRAELRAVTAIMLWPGQRWDPPPQQFSFFVVVKTEPEKEIYVIFFGGGGKHAFKPFHLILKLRKGMIKAHELF